MFVGMLNWTAKDGGDAESWWQNVENDRISSLPDEVLTHILSFLSTKEAVHMCVLSKRWRKTWSIIPVLDFDNNGFLMDGVDDDPGEEGRNFVASFEWFVHGVLDNRESTNLDIVRYSCKIQRCEAVVSMEWLDRVAALMLRVIHININGFDIYVFDVPDLVFSCASLHYLVMEFCITKRPIIEPMSIYLPSLKDLELTGVELPNGFAQKLFMGCPSLERLDLCFCDLYFSSISCMKLKKLSFVACDQFEEMQISCPDLVSLIFTSGEQKIFSGISFKDMASLVNATIKLHGLHYDDDDDDVPVPNLFGGLSNVTNLELHLNIPKLKNPFQNQDDTQLEPCQEVLGDVSFQHEYLETVKIKCWSNSEWASELIKILDKYVKKIGNIIIC